MPTLIQTAAASAFSTRSYLGRFFAEKELADVTFEKRGSNGEIHSIPAAVVVEFIGQTGAVEREKIEGVIRRIDFANGDVLHFLDHLSGAIAANY